MSQSFLTAAAICATDDTDALGRALTPGEQMWLAQSSLLCLVARLSEHMTQAFTQKALTERVIADATTNPFLLVGIDVATMRFKRSSGPKVTSETLAEDDLPAVRAAAQCQLQLGIDRAVCLARVHLLRSSSGGESYLLLIADHLCFDGRSLMAWLEGLTEPAVSVASEPVLPLIAWTDIVPASTSFDSPYESPVDTIRLLPKTPLPDAAETANMVVEDVVVTLDAATCASLRARTKERGTTLNAPLMAAFLAGMADAALKAGEVDKAGVRRAVDVRSVCAVDLRARLGIPLRYMNSSSAVVPVHASFECTKAGDAVDGAQLWPAALAAQAVMIKHIEDGEAFRLHDITKRGAFAEFGPYFDILCLWSNMGVVKATGVETCEVHLRGSATNPIISGHPITTGGVLALTLTFSPAHHARETVEYAASRFLHHIHLLATA